MDIDKVQISTPFFYMHSHLREPKNRHTIISANFSNIIFLNNLVVRSLLFELCTGRIKQITVAVIIECPFCVSDFWGDFCKWIYLTEYILLSSLLFLFWKRTPFFLPYIFFWFYEQRVLFLTSFYHYLVYKHEVI